MTTLNDLKKSLKIHCESMHTGSYFISSSENRPGQLVVRDGYIVSIVYAGKFGQDAINALEKLSDVKFSFNEGVEFPTPVELSEPESLALMQSLGIEIANLVEAKVVEPEPEPADEQEYIEITYRGQKVRRPVNKKRETTAKKPVRIYRGQVIDD